MCVCVLYLSHINFQHEQTACTVHTQNAFSLKFTRLLISYLIHVTFVLSRISDRINLTFSALTTFLYCKNCTPKDIEVARCSTHYYYYLYIFFIFIFNITCVKRRIENINALRRVIDFGSPIPNVRNAYTCRSRVIKFSIKIIRSYTYN